MKTQTTAQPSKVIQYHQTQLLKSVENLFFEVELSEITDLFQTLNSGFTESELFEGMPKKEIAEIFYNQSKIINLLAAVNDQYTSLYVQHQREREVVV
jgi:hypothetical protein